MNNTALFKTALPAIVILIVLAFPIAQSALAQSGSKSENATNSSSGDVQSQVQESLDMISQIRNDPQQQTVDRQKRIQSIQNRIDLLKKLAEKSQQESKQVPDAAQAKPAMPNQAFNKPPALENITVPPQAQNNIPPNLQDTQNRSLQNAPEPGTDAAPIQDTDPFPTELSTPIDAAQLANSLYLSGNWKQALEQYKAYKEQHTMQFSNDIWAMCMTAHCYRLSGDLNMAEGYYRELAASKIDSYAVDISKWYLSHLSKRKQLYADFEALSSEADALQKENNR